MEQEHPQEKIVYQVRSVNVGGRQRIVHAYETQALAESAAKTMSKSTGRIMRRYIVVSVKNNLKAHWGVHPPSIPPSRGKQPTQQSAT